MDSAAGKRRRGSIMEKINTEGNENFLRALVKNCSG